MKNHDDYKVWEMLVDMDSSFILKILKNGVKGENDPAIFPTIFALIRRDCEEDIAELFLSMMANDQLNIGTEKMKEVFSFILEEADKNSRLYKICCCAKECDTRAEFLEKMNLCRVYMSSADGYYIARL